MSSDGVAIAGRSVVLVLSSAKARTVAGRKMPRLCGVLGTTFTCLVHCTLHTHANIVQTNRKDMVFSHSSIDLQTIHVPSLLYAWVYIGRSYQGTLIPKHHVLGWAVG